LLLQGVGAVVNQQLVGLTQAAVEQVVTELPQEQVEAALLLNPL
jgi:hypothetical protein